MGPPRTPQPHDSYAIALPFMGRDRTRSVQGGEVSPTQELCRASYFPTLTASPSVPPHKGEGGLYCCFGETGRGCLADVDAAIATFERNIEAQTGRSVSAWAGLVRGQGLEKHGQMVAWLKAEHGLSHGHANHVAKRALEAAAPRSNDDPVAHLFEGKEGLRPLYDRLAAMAAAMGSDVEVAPKKANASVRRRRQFALLQPQHPHAPGSRPDPAGARRGRAAGGVGQLQRHVHPSGEAGRRRRDRRRGRGVVEGGLRRGGVRGDVEWTQRMRGVSSALPHPDGFAVCPSP